MSTTSKRRYESSRRAATAGETRGRIVDSARDLFSVRGIDSVTIAQIAEHAEVSASSVYALFRSKSGILRELMQASLFGERFRTAQATLEGVEDAVHLIARTADVACAIYEGEANDLGLLRGSSAFSPELKAVEHEFENIRLEMQSSRIDQLFKQGKAKHGLEKKTAARLLWMYTGRDIFRMLVIESGWSLKRYRKWLSKVLVAELTNTPVRTDSDDDQLT